MKVFLGVCIVVSLFLYISGKDYEDDIQQAELYCANVKDKTWPDYKGTYRKECKNGKLRND